MHASYCFIPPGLPVTHTRRRGIIHSNHQKRKTPKTKKRIESKRKKGKEGTFFFFSITVDLFTCPPYCYCLSESVYISYLPSHTASRSSFINTRSKLFHLLFLHCHFSHPKKNKKRKKKKKETHSSTSEQTNKAWHKSSSGHFYPFIYLHVAKGSVSRFVGWLVGRWMVVEADITIQYFFIIDSLVLLLTSLSRLPLNIPYKFHAAFLHPPALFLSHAQIYTFSCASSTLPPP